MIQSGGFLIVSGRWDDNVAIVDMEAALVPENDCTPAAVISRPRVTPDLDIDGDGIAETRKRTTCGRCGGCHWRTCICRLPLG